jgi:D-aminopeptidase
MPERWRDIAGPVGFIEPGERNAITDVPGVRVGHAQARSGQRTGVTVIAPPALPALAGAATVNGTGELTGRHEIDELGRIESPVHLCGTHALGTVYQAAIEASGRGPGDVVIPVVGECDDGDLADSRTVVAADLEDALGALGPDVAEGSVGAGTGMQCYGFPGGIGTASRRVGGRTGYTVGVLLLCNFGDRPYLDVLGRTLGSAGERPMPHGSCIAVCATDAPLDPLGMRRLALRPLLGLARSGSYGADGSGEIAVSFSTAPEPVARVASTRGGETGPPRIDLLFAAAYEAAHEAVLNCLVAAAPAERLDGTMQEAFPVDQVRRWAAERDG